MPKKILVVDDDSAARMVLQSALEMSGYAVIEAVDGWEAISKIREHKSSINLILTDADMPNLNGWDLCKRLKDDQGTKLIPIVFITSNHLPEDHTKAKELGAIQLIGKPFEANQIIDAVRAVIGGP